MRYLFIVGMLVLAGCAGTAQTRAVNSLGIACDTYATLLDQVTAHYSSISDANINRVKSANKLVDKVCLPDSKVDPAQAVTTVQAGIELLKTVKEAF